jgi:ATP-binding cassette subfamily B protein
MNPRESLAQFPLFAAVRTASLEAWIDTGESMKVQVGETLFQAGTQGEHVFLLLDGRVRVLRISKSGREVPLGIFQKGEVFGEYAIVPPGKNTATCRVSEEGAVLRLPLRVLQAILKEQPTLGMHVKRWLRLHAFMLFVRNGPYLGFLSAPSVIPIQDRTETERFATGSTIQAEGLSVDRWFIIQEGTVLLKDWPKEPKRPPVTVGRGGSFGARGLLDGKDLPAAQAMTDVECLVLTREAFYRRLRDAEKSSCQSSLYSPAQPGSYPWVGQRDANDCGVAALTMVARFHGRLTEGSRVARSAILGERGMSLVQMLHGARALGFQTRPVRIVLHQLCNVVLPAIAHLHGNHFVVIYEVGPNGIVVGDPLKGIVTIGTLEFRDAWDGTLLLLKPAWAKHSAEV